MAANISTPKFVAQLITAGACVLLTAFGSGCMGASGRQPCSSISVAPPDNAWRLCLPRGYDILPSEPLRDVSLYSSLGVPNRQVYALTIQANQAENSVTIPLQIARTTSTMSDVYSPILRGDPGSFSGVVQTYRQGVRVMSFADISGDNKVYYHAIQFPNYVVELRVPDGMGRTSTTELVDQIVRNFEIPGR